ncbi:MAG: TIGR03032 family protein [Sulfuricurvum sp.]|uniref:TIGR03032 family protein n=1 Tax=Sulfuricurvum sp. TaxID=2025608 RepID=UPI0025E77588|nr:TIGR03032 family protein [Sulfuricurvum sp.]MBV5320305.1 TIGR03032 family protein [Sulfuricurvum sp.]
MKKQPNQSSKIDFNYSVNLVSLLEQMGVTILMSTYQAGKIMVIGADQGKLDLRYKEFPRPMGMVTHQGKLWAGLGHGIWQFANYAGAASKIEPQGSYDACYLPQNIHFTADIDIHEMEFCKDQLYFVNTKFSCLCIDNGNSSFKPIWTPPFISLLQPIDKCHLNGFCTRDGEPRYVTALGTSDEPLGWRATKADGGILMDITTNTVLAKGLSMPHSPRWHQDKLWLLESGKGSLSYYDFKKKKVIEVTALPGFTRGLQMVGDLAFIGLSKVRESVTFSGLPITKLPKRVAGVWVVNIKTGQIVSFIEFTDGIDEVFAVSVLPHRHMDIYGFDHDLSKGNYMIAPEDIEQVKMAETAIERAAPYFEKGNDFFNENKKEEAIEEFKKALAIQSDYLPATFNMAVALGDLDRFDEALEVLHDVIDKDASILEAYDSLGYVYYKRGDLKMAKVNYEKILELNPEHLKAKNALAIIAKELKVKKKK